MASSRLCRIFRSSGLARPTLPKEQVPNAPSSSSSMSESWRGRAVLPPSPPRYPIQQFPPFLAGVKPLAFFRPGAQRCVGNLVRTDHHTPTVARFARGPLDRAQPQEWLITLSVCRRGDDRHLLLRVRGGVLRVGRRRRVQNDPALTFWIHTFSNIINPPQSQAKGANLGPYTCRASSLCPFYLTYFLNFVIHVDPVIAVFDYWNSIIDLGIENRIYTQYSWPLNWPPRIDWFDVYRI